MKRDLAESENYKVTSEYEMVSLHFKAKDRDPIYIGDFYGDPDSAIISSDENYVAMAGCGLIIYKLQEPFDEYLDENTNQYFVFNNTEPNIWWTSNVHQSSEDKDPKFFRFAKEENSKKVIYRFDISTNTIDNPLQNPADT
ncbi:MAG: hypothetical protein JNM51_01820 [Bacteroidia bacterium]|nr:hypothetical protein [Bacteroidia bacterium]